MNLLIEIFMFISICGSCIDLYFVLSKTNFYNHNCYSIISVLENIHCALKYIYITRMKYEIDKYQYQTI